MLVEPLKTREAGRLIREIVRNGSVAFTGHAFAEMAKDDLATTDVINMLRGGVVEPAEFENGSWRHRVRTARICVVVAFRSATELRVVTAWRMKP
ncbi:MAG: DUF4258 domain-containing protein [Deltaproteobacteria bacterium]|nr:DUF4258 domain-containing protein [Deltaproteobacteria bacterium]